MIRLHSNNKTEKTQSQIALESESCTQNLPASGIWQRRGDDDQSPASGLGNMGTSNEVPFSVPTFPKIPIDNSPTQGVNDLADPERSINNNSYFHNSQLKEKLIKGHRYFIDCERETWARLIDWAFKKYDVNDVWFFTGTYRYCYNNFKRPNEIFEKYILRLKQALITLDYGADLRFIKADELQIRGAVHHHAIIAGKGLSLLSRRRWEEKWKSLAGIARIGLYNRRTAPYLSKYIGKGYYGNESNISIGGNWNGLHVPDWIYCCNGDRSRGAMALSQEHASKKSHT